MAKDIANAVPRPAFANDGQPSAARVYPDGKEPAKGNQTGGKPLQSGATELAQEEPHG